MNCEQCKLRFNTKQRRPIFSECGHTTCQKCRTTLQKCPECQVPMNMEKWTVNLQLQKMLKSKGLEVDKLVKVCLIGDSGVGKTSLKRRLCRQGFTQSMHITLSCEFMLINVDINGLNVQFQLWDTAGQERFFSICRNTYQIADMIILVTDVKKRHPYEYYEQKIEQHCKEDVKKCYVVNKIDENPSIKRQQGFYYLSCKTNQGVDELFTAIKEKAMEIPKRQLQEPKQPNVKIYKKKLRRNVAVNVPAKRAYCC